MTISNEYHGLCATCKSSPYCTFPVRPTESVFQCEEFEGTHINPVNLKRNLLDVSRSSIPLQTWSGTIERVHNTYRGCAVRVKAVKGVPSRSLKEESGIARNTNRALNRTPSPSPVTF